jgi:cyanate permease
MSLPDDERARLDASARTRAQHSLRTVVLIVVAVGLVGYAAGMVAGNDAGAAIWIIAALPVVLALVLAVLFHRLAARRPPPLTSGADWETKRDVNRALRAGGTDDPRIDALVQDLRTKSARSDTVLMWLFAATASVQAVTLVVVERPWGRAMAGLACACSLAAAALFWLQRRRVRRYRGLEPASRRAKGHLRRLAGDQEEYTSSSDS